MTAVDTNILVRIITRDNAEQAERAVAFLEREESVFLAKTVLLEFEWVLRGIYKYGRSEVLSALGVVLSIDNAEIEDAVAVTQAIDWYAQGMDFADSLHLASAPRPHRFASFDAALRRRTMRIGTADVVCP